MLSLMKSMNTLPVWTHPRFPLVANELRRYNALDFRIAQISFYIRLIFIYSCAGLLVSFPSVMVGLGQFYGLLIFPLIVMLGPVAVVVSELLYTRIIYSLPFQTAQMIAGEIRRGTWDVLLSTPIPRYQIILSKFSAQFWNAEPALIPLLTARITLIGFIVLEGLVFRRTTPNLMTVLNLGTLGLFIALMPVLELYAFTGVGILVSYFAPSVAQATLANWAAWMFYRLSTALLLLSTYLEPSVGIWLTFWGLLLFFPHWGTLLLLIVRWGFAAPNPHWLTYTSVYVILPLTIGSLGLIVTIYLLQRR